MVGTAQERLCPPYEQLRTAPHRRPWADDTAAELAVRRVGKAAGRERVRRRADHSAPGRLKMVGTAQERLCPPFGPRCTHELAGRGSPSTAIHHPRKAARE